MGIENFIKTWTIRESSTTVIAMNDQLQIDRVGSSPKVKFHCDSPNPGTSDLWDDVNNCKWSDNGGPAGHLQGTISDQTGSNYPLVITYLEVEGNPNQIHLEVVGVPVSGEVVANLIGNGGGGAGGDDDPPPS